MAKDWFSGGGGDWFTDNSDDSSQSLKKRVKKLAEDQGIPEIGSEEWTNNLAAEIDKQRQEKAKKDEEERKKAEQEAKVKAGRGHKNILEKIGDAFEANSPQDKAKREAKGEPTNYQDQQKKNKEAEDKGKAFDLTPEQIAERKDFYARQNFDLEKYAKTKDEYAVVHKGLEESKGNGTIFGKKKNSLKDVDLKGMAQKAEEQGLFAGNEDASKDLEWAKQLDKEGSKMARTIYAQAIAKATKEVGMDDERKKIEGMYQTTKQQEKDGGGNIPQKLGRGFTTGFAESFIEVPSNAQSLASNALDIVAPEGSRLDKFAQERFTDAAKDNAGVKQEMKDKGLGPNEEGGFWSNLGQAGGSLGAAAMVGPGGAGAEAKGFWASVKAFAKPSVVGTLFGINKGGDIVRESRAAGNDPLEAGVVSGASAYAEGVLENFGLTKMFGRFGTGKITGLVGGAITEGSQEFLQDITTSTLQTTYKDVDWKEALGQALQSAEYGAILGGGTGVVTGGMEKPKTVDQTLSEELQKQGVAPEDADAIGAKYAEDIKNKLTQVGEQAGQLEDGVTPEGEDVPEVMTTKPQESGPSSIPGTNISDQPVTDQPTDVPVEDTTTPAPTATPPPVEATDSAKDWEDNYADKYAEIDNQINTLDEQIKSTPKADQPPLKLQKDGLVAQQVQMEKEFRDKWKDKVNPENPEENLKQAKPIQHKIGEDNLVSIDEKRLAESTASDNQYRKASYEEAVNMTGADAREVARNAIRAYVHRGDSLESLRAGQGGGTAQGGHYSIGGYLSSGKTTTHDIVVSLDDGREYKYKLKDIYDEVKAEARPQRTGKPKPLTQKEKFGNDTFDVTNITDEYIRRVDAKDFDGADRVLTRLVELPAYESSKNLQERAKKLKDYKAKAEKSEVKGKPKKLGKADAQIKYPETKDLPENLKERVPLDDKQFQKDGKQVPKASDKLTPNEAQRVAEAPQSLRKSELATIIKLVPGLKDNPVFKVTRFDGDLAISYKSSDGKQTGTVKLNKIGISDERAESVGLKEGMTVDLSEVMNTKAKGKVPVIRNNQTGQEANELEPVIETEGKSAAGYTPALTPQELEDRIDQLNKAGGKATVLRRGGLKSKKNAGVFQHPRKKGTDPRGVVKLQDKVINDPVQYMRTLGHELSHAIENSINGNNHTTLKLFGDLSKEETKQISDELEAVSRKLIGDDVYDSKPDYYGKPTEQLARFVETLLIEPSSAESLAPLTLAKWEEATVTHPQIAQFVEAVKGKMDNGAKVKVWSVWADLRQTFQKKLGKSLGTIAYNAEVSRRAMHQYWQQEVAKTIAEKFKGVKDDPALLMQSAESIKGVDENGNLIFGTKDRMVARTAEEVDMLVEAGFELDNIIINEQTNEKTAQMSRDRYTEEQGQKAFDDLTPEGQKLIRDFVGAKEDAKDLFNRDLLKEVFKIDGNIEGWVHRGLREKEKGKMNLSRKIKDLRERDAGMARKRKSVSDGYVKDFKLQMTKALLDAGEVDINNTFIAKQLARISKPIAKGASPDKGWVEVIYDPRKGMTLPGEVGREKVTIETVMFDDTPEGFIDMSGKPIKVGQKSFLKPQNRYQVPKELAEYYRNIRTVPEEITVTRRVLENISKYWAINVLLHGGTVGTNFVGGGIQYTTKILDDFYGELLTGDVSMQKTRNNIAALVQVLTPKGWTESPDYVYGGHYTNYAGQFMERSKSESAIGKLGDYGLKPFSLVESYWKKVIMTAENKGGYSKVELSNQMKQFSQEEEAMLGAINEIVDLYAYDYDNVPMWLATWSRKGGLIKPFMKYPYKYMKLITNHAGAVFDKSLPPQERIAKLLTLTTMVAAVLALDDWREKKQETPEGSEKTPSSLDPRGRLMVWKNSTEEFFLRTAKYPFFNVASVGKAAIKGDWGTVGDVMADQLGTVGPFAKSILIGFGYTNEFEKYTPKDALIAQQMATFIPGFRILNDVGKWIDTKPRLPGNFTQGIFNTLPVWGSDETKEKLRGKAKTLDIPVEPESRSMSKSSTYTKDLEIHRSDLLLSALTGIYLTRITPSEAQAQAMREHRNDTEKAVRELMKKHQFAEAQKLAGDAGLTIPPDSYSYYRRNYNPDGTKKKKSEDE